MAEPTLDEMYGHLQSAHEAGDKELASAIAQRIKTAEDTIHPPQDFMDRVGQAIQGATTLGPATKAFFGIPDKEKVLTGTDLVTGLGKQGLKAAALLMPASKVLQGLGWGGKLAAGALQGAGSGALMAAGDTKSNDLGDIANNAVSGAESGGLVGGGLSGVGLASGALLNKARPYLETASQKFGNMASRGYANIAAKKIISPEAMEQAYRTGIIAKGDTVTNIADKVRSQAAALSSAKQGITQGMDAVGMRVDSGPFIVRLEKAAADARGRDFGPLAKTLDNYADKVREVAAIHDPLTGQIPVDAFEALKTSIGKGAKESFAKVEGKASTLGQAQMDAYGMFKREAEEAVRAQASLAPDLAAAFVPAKKELGNALSVSDASVTGKAREWARRLPFASVLGGGYGGVEGYKAGGVKGALEGALIGGAASTLGHAAISRAPSTLGVLSRDLARLNPTATTNGISKRIPAIVQYLRDMQKEPEDAP